MPKSHVCMGCGKDLVWVHAVIDPSLGAVVVCPDCATGAVRLPSQEPARRRFWQAIRLLILQVGAASLSLLFYVLVAGAIADFTEHTSATLEAIRARPEDYLADVQVPLLGALAVTVITGVWLGVSFRHFRKPTVLAVYISAVMLIFLWSPLMRTVDDVLIATAGQALQERPPREHGAQVSNEVGVALAMGLPTALSLAASNGVARLARLASGMTFRARLARARKKRHPR
jgi:hypothetical protein